jgi:hypothetical protein
MSESISPTLTPVPVPAPPPAVPPSLAFADARGVKHWTKSLPLTNV